METETNETNDITPEIARKMTQEALNWDYIVQNEINLRVPDMANAGKRKCHIVIELPVSMKRISKTTQEIIKGVFVRKGWKIKDFSANDCCGAVLVDIEW